MPNKQLFFFLVVIDAYKWRNVANWPRSGQGHYHHLLFPLKVVCHSFYLLPTSSSTLPYRVFPLQFFFFVCDTRPHRLQNLWLDAESPVYLKGVCCIYYEFLILGLAAVYLAE